MPKIVEDEKIYRAAMQLVAERGYAGATTRQIAEAAGISEVTLFRKYGNKAELIRRAIIAIAQQIDFANATNYTGDVAADLLRVAQLYQDSVEKNGQFYYAILSEVPRYPELAGVIETPLNMMAHVGQLLGRYQTEDALNQESPLHAVAALLGPLMITNMIRATSTDVPLPPIDLANHIELFLNGRKKQRS